MSVSTDSPHQILPSTTSTMTPEPAQPRRSCPSQVRTDIAPNTQLVVIPPSAISNSSASSVWPSSQHGSPTQSLEAVGSNLTAASSLQDSPEPLEHGLLRKGSDELVTPLQLPEAVIEKRTEPANSALSRRTSNTSLGQGPIRSPSSTAMGEAVRSMSIVRRASNSVRSKAQGFLTRRASSTHPSSRDGSVGPGVMRRRGSMSNPNPSFENISPFETDSDDEVSPRLDEGLGSDGTSRDLSFSNAIPLGAGFGSISFSILQGTVMTKVTKKKSTRRILLALDLENAKIRWEKSRASKPKSIYIDDIKEIRTGADTRQYRLDANISECHEHLFFSLIYTVPEKSGTKVLHLMAEHPSAFQAWIQALEIISRHRQDFAASLMAFNDKAVRAYWEREMDKQFRTRKRLPEDEQIDFSGVERVCRSLHIHVSSEELRRKFDAAKGKRESPNDVPSRAGTKCRLNFSEFLEFVRLMKTREDIRRVYQAHAADQERGMTKEEFLRFLHEVQNESVDDDMANWEVIFARFARKGKAKDSERQSPGTAEDGLVLSEAAFAAYLTSTSNVVIPKEPPQGYTLDRPVNEYYISSSHNTYLLGRQVAGVSSVEGYISALSNGCRCVEVDCWDGPDDQPVVMHGHTLTTRISFVEVIKTINRYAFVKSHFPLWISLEVRCGPATQANMVKIMNEIFGDKLVKKPLENHHDTMPSPSELMERILIKVKKPQEPTIVGRRRGNSMPSPYQRALPDSGQVPASPLLSPTPLSRSNRHINTITEGQVHDTPSSSPSECDSESEKDSGKKFNSKITPALGELGVYCMGIQFDGFESAESKSFNHIYSFKEKTFAEKNQPGPEKRALYRHNMRHLMRVYPNGGRITSSNFDPLIYWKRGVQMAALNWQTFDLGMQLNRAMFDGGTDQSGYVLKPLEGRQIQVLPHLSADECVGKRPRKRITFDIDIISAQQLMRPHNLGEKRTLDPYIEIEVFLADDKRNKADAANVTAQEAQLKQHTGIVRDNGFNPIFNKSCSFDITTKYPDLIFVRWNVKQADNSSRGYNDKAPPLATFTAKLSNLKQGYRTIPLLDQSGDRFLFSTLFCKIRKGPIQPIMVSYQEEPPRNGNKLKNIGRNVFNQSNNSPKSSIESSRS
ncbi:putative 1-phosphatidylinositol-4,5-bisphosphate phosphodiesterase 1 [Podospora australis]|uniref:Phosphoinositide phospholipase C n=1 Tax=Podospora australis TaxID=1536484 RepID=A0AAN7AN89_9PEZI|nr:putative 1-phosphatidylinositol-4,5-bisphosphate phosphodiesterase 1 [Podospora australis]